jgi:hypothetical protein
MMTGRDIFHYGWRYAAFYVGALAAVLAGTLVAAALFDFVPGDMSIGAFIFAAFMTYNRFLQDRQRLPTRSEYWSLVLLCTVIMLVVDVLVSIYALKIELAPEGSSLIILLMIGVPLFKGLFGHCLFFSRFLGKRTLQGIQLQNAKKKAGRSA